MGVGGSSQKPPALHPVPLFYTGVAEANVSRVQMEEEPRRTNLTESAPVPAAPCTGCCWLATGLACTHVVPTMQQWQQLTY